MHVFLAVSWAATMLFSGCSTTALTAPGKAVRVVKGKADAANGRHLGTVTAEAGNFSAGLLFSTRESCLKQLRNRAAELGGNTVVLVSENGSSVYVRMKGEVFR